MVSTKTTKIESPRNIMISQYLVLGHEVPYYLEEHSDLQGKRTEEDITKMPEFLIDNIFVAFAGKVFQQIIGIPMGTKLCPSPSRRISVR